MTEAARFFVMPVRTDDGKAFVTNDDGTLKMVPSSVQMIPGPDGSPRPLAVKTPQQLKEWAAIQEVAPLSSTAHEAQINARYRATALEASGGDSDTGRFLAQARAEAEASVSAGITNPVNPETGEPYPVNRDNWQQRADAAAALAATLDLTLVWVAVTDGLGNPPHFELRQPTGNALYMGHLVTIEKQLHAAARERAVRDAQLRLHAEHMARVEAKRQQDIANLPENRLARLEAALAARGITLEDA